MREIRRGVLLVLCAAAVVLVLGAPALAQSRSYHVSEVRVDAELWPDGSLQVTEHRTFRYRGTYFGAFYTLPLRGDQRVVNFALTDSRGHTYQPARCQADGERQPGTYQIEEGRRQFKVTWCYATPATDEDLTSTLSYVVTRAATRHDDAAELYWQWVGTGWEVPTERVVADVRIEGAHGLTVGEDLLVWGHGPLQGRVDVVEPGLIRTQVEGLPARTFVELRALMPPEVLSAATSDGRSVRDAIVAEEHCFAVAADAERARARGEEPAEDCDPYAARHRLANIATLIGLVGGGALWSTIFFKHGREHALPAGLADYERELPSDDPPALVDWLMGWGNTRDPALVATIMDLARRKHIRIERETRERRRVLRTRTEDLLVLHRVSDPTAAFERDVMRLLFDRAGDGQTVTDQELKDWVSKNRQSAYQWWQGFTKKVRKEAIRHHWIEPKGWVAASLLLGLALIGAAVALAIVMGAALPIVAAAVAAGATMMVASPLMRRRTPAGRVLHHRWGRFGAFLRDYSLVPERGPEYLALWGTYLVYAIPLGVGDEVMRNLDARLSAAELERATGGYYPMAYGRGGQPSLSNSFAALSAAVPASTIASSPSSSSGGGGGFSGGGGGGGGGSGGGSF